jgi:hypothetical protein
VAKPAERYSSRARKIARGSDTSTKNAKLKDLRWWKHEEPHKAIFEDGKRIARVTRWLRMQDLYFACLYDDSELAAIVQGSGAIGTYTPQTLSSNIVKRQVDTYVAKISKNRPVPMGLTTAGNYSQQRRAKSLSKFFEGVLDNIEFWPTRENRIRDSAIFGSGYAYNYRVGRQFHHDRIFPWEIEVDPREAMYGKPRTFRLKRYVDRLELQERYPKFAEEIADAEAKTDEDQFDIGWDETCDLVLLRGAWHLRSSETSDDGAFCLAVSNCTLENKKYERDYPPFSQNNFLPPLMGWRGQGMVKPLTGLQYEVNAIGMRLQECGYMTGTYAWLPPGVGIETDLLDNGTLSIIRSQVKPDFMQPAPWHPAFFDYYLALRGQFPAEESRISEMSTRGETPTGLKSGRALRTHHDIEAEGFTPQGRNDERDVINTCWQMFDLAEEVYDDPGEKSEADKQAKKKPYTVMAESRSHGRNVLEEIEYEKVRLDKEQFTLRVFPTSFLSGTPEDRLDTVRELIDSGFLSQDEALALLDFPDLQRVMNLRGAARRNVERLLEKIRDAEGLDAINKAYEYPEPAWNLELCKALALMAYLEAKLDGVPEDNLKKILQFATDAQNELDGDQQTPDDAAAAAAAAQQDASMDPNAMPVDPNAPINPAMAGDPNAQYAPPEAPPLPANAVAPTVMPGLPV